jgi:hypothetical protein
MTSASQLAQNECTELPTAVRQRYERREDDQRHYQRQHQEQAWEKAWEHRERLCQQDAGADRDGGYLALGVVGRAG